MPDGLRHERTVGPQPALAVDVDAKVDVLALEQRLAVARGELEDLPRGRRDGVDAGVAGEAQHIAHDPVEAARGAEDLLDARGGRGVAGDIRTEHLRVERDRAEGIADLMRDAGGHLAERGKRPRAAEPFVRLRELALEPLDLPREGGVRLLQPCGRLRKGPHELREVAILTRCLRHQPALSVNLGCVPPWDGE